MPHEPTYLYAITDRCEFGEEDLTLPGLDGLSPARVVADAGLGCVVSRHSGDDPRAVARDRLFRYLLRHQQIVEAVMRERTVLPVKFGTILGDSSEVALLLAQARERLAKALESARGRVQFEVAATWDPTRALGAVRLEPAVAGAVKALAVEKIPTTADRVRIGQLVKIALDCRKDSYREMVLARLRPLSHGVVSNPLMSDELVVNEAFLIDRAQQSEFDRQIEELDRLTGNEIQLRTIGPLPPYSFHTVHVTRVSAQDVEEARVTLGLSGRASEREIGMACRNLVARELRTAQAPAAAAAACLAKLRQAKATARAARRNGSPGDAGPWFLVSVDGLAHQDIEPARYGARAGA